MKHLMSVSKDLATTTDPLKAVATKNLKVCDSVLKTPEEKGVTRKAPITKTK